MKKLSTLNRMRYSAGMAALAFVFGLPIAAEAGQQQSLPS